MNSLLLLFDGFHVDGGLGGGAFYAVFGLMFVVLGIALMICILTLVGLIMKKFNARKAKKKTPPAAAEERLEVADGIPPEVVAAITAAIAVYTAQEETKCDFVVRRIKRLR